MVAVSFNYSNTGREKSRILMVPNLISAAILCKYSTPRNFALRLFVHQTNGEIDNVSIELPFLTEMMTQKYSFQKNFDWNPD